MPGKLTIVMGPMFAGKTTELQRRVKREIYACRMVCVIKYQKDTRYSHSSVATHDKTLLKATYACDRLCEIPESEWRRYDTVVIDEGQFFPDLVTFCSTVADAGKSVLVVALDGDFLRRPFGQVCQLIPMAEEVHKLTAACMSCHTRDASFTRRTVTSNATELIGGSDMYIAVCRDCYNHPHPPTPGRVEAYRTAVRECEQVMHPRAVSASVPALEPAAVAATPAALSSTPSLTPASPLQLRAQNSAGALTAASPSVKLTLLPPPLPSMMAGARRERDGEVPAAAIVVDLPMPLI